MTRKETLKNEIVMIGSGKSAPFYLLTENSNGVIKNHLGIMDVEYPLVIDTMKDSSLLNWNGTVLSTTK